MKKFISIILCFAALLCFAGCEKNESSPTYNTTVSNESSTTEASVIETEIVITETVSTAIDLPTPATVPSAMPPTTEETTPETTVVITSKEYEKTGDMAFSDEADNKYIKAISSKYKIDSSALVALYTVPENDSNIVLQFDGTKNSDGSLKRTADTLIAIYSIDKELNSKRASEDKELNEYSYGEMKVMFFTVTKHIMPEFDELK